MAVNKPLPEKQKVEIGALVSVVWYDAFIGSKSEWTTLEDVDVKHRPIHTVGHEILGLSDEYMVIAHSYDEGAGTIDHAMVIPVGMVQTIKVIK